MCMCVCMPMLTLYTASGPHFWHLERGSDSAQDTQRWRDVSTMRAPGAAVPMDTLGV